MTEKINIDRRKIRIKKIRKEREVFINLSTSSSIRYHVRTVCDLSSFLPQVILKLFMLIDKLCSRAVGVEKQRIKELERMRDRVGFVARKLDSLDSGMDGRLEFLKFWYANLQSRKRAKRPSRTPPVVLSELLR